MSLRGGLRSGRRRHGEAQVFQQVFGENGNFADRTGNRGARLTRLEDDRIADALAVHAVDLFAIERGTGMPAHVGQLVRIDRRDLPADLHGNTTIALLSLTHLFVLLEHCVRLL